MIGAGSQVGPRPRRWLVIAALLSLASVALLGSTHAAPSPKPTFVQRKYVKVESGKHATVRLPKPNGAGNLIVAYVVSDGGGLVAVTDTRGNAYLSAIGPSSSGGRTAQIFYAKDIASGPNAVTATFASAITRETALYVHEYSGIDRDTPVDAAIAATGALRSMASGLLATRAANALLFVGAESDGNVTKLAPAYTARAHAFGVMSADRVLPTPGSYGTTAAQSGTAWVMQVVAFRAAGGGPVDTTPPSVPTGVHATDISSNAVTIAWTASTDAGGVAGYTVFRNNRAIATTSDTVFPDTGLSPATAYAYAVAAYDQTGNSSAPSAAVTVTTAGAPGPAYPLKVSATRRYLVDQRNTPFLITGDSPQALMVNLSVADAESFFANRQSAGFNLVWINLLCATYTGGRADGSTYDGIVPFTTPFDLSTPNEAYFARVDQMLRLAAQHGLTVLLDPAETGSFFSVLTANGAAKARAYGQYLGRRYRSFDNIIWMSGNDFQTWMTPGDDAVVQAVALGIRDTDDRHLQTVELDYPVSGSLDDPSWAPIVQLNASYTYFPTYAQVLTDYNRPDLNPTFLVEANYEFEHNAADLGTPGILRRQAYWALLSGAAGHLYGNHYTWPFSDGWQSHVDTPGSAQMGYAKALFESRPWYGLIPDQTHTVVTAGNGNFADNGSLGANNYLAAARTPDGALVMAYMPTVRTIGVDLSQLAGPVTARWYDPSNGTFAAIAGSPFSNAGTRQFRPPGANADGDGDWVLVLEAPSAPRDTQAPSVPTGLTASVSSSAIGLAWSAAQDNTGVTGYQVFRDGALIATTTALSHDDVALTPRTTYAYAVAAFDAFGNASAPSPALTVTTAGPAPTFVQQAYATPQSPQPVVVAAFGGAQAAGDANIIAIGWNDTASSITSVTDSIGNTYQTAIATFRGNGLSQAIYYAPGIEAAAAGNQVTVTFDRPAAFVDLRIAEYAGLSDAAALDGGTSATGHGTNARSGALVTAGPSELLFTAGVTSASFTGVGAGYTTRVITVPDGDLIADALTTSSGSHSATATLSSGAWILQLAAFRSPGETP
jgi:chitodextrinase